MTPPRHYEDLSPKERISRLAKLLIEAAIAKEKKEGEPLETTGSPSSFIPQRKEVKK